MTKVRNGLVGNDLSSRDNKQGTHGYVIAQN